MWFLPGQHLGVERACLVRTKTIVTIGSASTVMLCLLCEVTRSSLKAGYVKWRETQTIAILREIYTCEEEFRSQVLKDLNGDGVGEYGTLDELMGYEKYPSVMSNSIIVGKDSAYDFRLVLETESAKGLANGYSVTAWPIAYRDSGVRSFVMDSTGLVRGLDIGGKEPAAIEDTSTWPVVGGTGAPGSRLSRQRI